MSYSSRHRYSRRAYADTSERGHAPYDDYGDYSRPMPVLREHLDGHKGYHSRVTFDSRDPRDNGMTGGRFTVTRYRIGSPTTSFHDRREYTVHTHRSPSGYQDDSDEGHRDQNRRTGDDRYHEERKKRSSQQVSMHQQPEKPRPTARDHGSSKSKSYNSHKYATNHPSSQDKPESGSSRRQERSHSSRNENHCGEDARSNKPGPSHEDRDQRCHGKVPPAKVTKSLPDHYATLKLGPLATDQEIKSAARSRRIEVHPDRLKTPDMSDAERAKIDAAAAAIGQAADVLQSRVEKKEYDREYYAVKGWKWHGK